jgi:hypothetical protein
VTYGGAAGSGLSLVVSAGTSSGFKLLVKAGANTLSTYDNMANGAALVAAITNAPDPNVTAVVGTSSLVAANGTFALTGGGTGKATVVTLQGIGAYAGSAGNNLTATVTAGTTSGFKLTIADSVLNTTLSTYDNQLNNASLFSAARGDANIAVQMGTSTNAAAALTATHLAGGLDGVNTAGSSPTVANMLSLLFSGMVTAPRYVCLLWDASAVEAAVVTALNSAAAQTVPVLCMAFLGSALAGTISANATLAGTIANPRVWLWGLPGGVMFDPTINALRSFAGFYVAATAMALKAALPVQTSLIGQTLPGWTDNTPIIDSTNGITRAPILSDVSSLGAAGASYGLAGPGYVGLQIVDSLTTAVQTGQNGWQSQPAMQDGLHHAQSLSYQAAQAFNGQSATVNGSFSNAISARLHTALKPLEGKAINQVLAVSTQPDPTTLGRYLPQVSVSLAPTVRAISFQFAVTVQP